MEGRILGRNMKWELHKNNKDVKNHNTASQFCVKNIQRGDLAREGLGAKTEEETSGCHKGILYYVSFSNFFRSPICHIPTKPTVECPNFGSLTLTANPSAFWTN